MRGPESVSPWNHSLPRGDEGRKLVEVGRDYMHRSGPKQQNPRRGGRLAAASALIGLVLLGCGGANETAAATPPLASPGGGTVRVPLDDPGIGTYLGFRGGLYPGGANVPPSDHATAGRAHAVLVEPRDASGRPSATGRFVLLSIGMSNTTQEFCSAGGAPPCESWSFVGQAAADPAVNHATLAFANGAFGGRTAAAWDAPSRPDYDRVRDEVLARQGLTEAQVEVAWVKVANAQPRASLPSPGADAFQLVTQMADIVRALKARYPNLQLVFLSSRIYAGYATTTLNPEPYAYESGFAVKWLVEAQIRQREAAGRVVDARAGDLDDRTVAPWIGWGPYLWADGLTARADGLVWERADLEADGTHPSRSGEAKVASLLRRFFETSPASACWFLRGESCP